ncbi:MAG: biotin/lipoyl-binding protein [Candidatus Solibacter usitatus]|nr:biotin/lipoyl-binding protein [Candidatus Solibacter usitatus]
MNVRVRINQREASLDYRQDGETCRFRFESQQERDALVALVEPGVYSVLLDGASFEARVEEDGERVWVSLRGHRFAVEVLDPRKWTGGGRGAHLRGRQELTAPMPGKVVRVLVAEGDPVEAGQGLVVVEAMKMQNELKAARAGRVVSVAAAAGATVAAGEVLAVVE